MHATHSGIEGVTAEQIANIATQVEQRMSGEGTGHDWFHVERVVRVAEYIAEHEGASLGIVTLAALLHDIADHKFHGGDRTVGPRVADELMTAEGVPEPTRAQVCDIIANVSFSGSGGAKNMVSLEGMCVQDADRLDAIGAIGIGRAFAYGGAKGRALYATSNNQHTLAHFDEKLLKLFGLLNTNTGRSIGKKRHAVLEEFKQQFLSEWNSHDINEAPNTTE